MENDLKTALAVSLIRNKPDGIDIADYVTSIQSKIMEKESELFFQEFLCDSDSNKPSDRQSIVDNVYQTDVNGFKDDDFNVDLQGFEELCTYVDASELFEQQPIKNNAISTIATSSNLLTCSVDYQELEELYTNILSPEKNLAFDFEITSASNCTSNLHQKPSTCLIQPVIAMKSLFEITKIPFDSGYNTYNWKNNSQFTNVKPVEIMSQSIQESLNLFQYTLFDNSKLLDAVINWSDSNNLVRYFINLIANMADSYEYGFTCSDQVIKFAQNTAFIILDNHHLYTSIQVEYQCNLFAKFCYDKYIRWKIINLLINRLKIDIQIVPSSCNLRSIFYTFHLIEKLFNNIDFYPTTVTIKNKNSLNNLWKNNYTNKCRNEKEIITEQPFKEWLTLLEHVSMEALKKNVFLVSKRANQCLESLKLLIPN